MRVPFSKGLLPGVTKRLEKEEEESEAEIWGESLPGRGKRQSKSKEDRGGRVAADFGTTRRGVQIQAQSLGSCVWPWASPRTSLSLGFCRTRALSSAPPAARASSCVPLLRARASGKPEGRQNPLPPFSQLQALVLDKCIYSLSCSNAIW